MTALLRYRAVYLAAALAVILLATGLRLHALGTQSLWNDEGASAAMIQRAPATIVALSAADIHPPGYYLLLAAWAGLAGTSEFGLRALSALESVLTVALVIALGRRLGGRSAGLLAAFVLALHTLALYYAQEARMYAQLGLLATAGMWLLAVILTPGRDDAPRPVWPFVALGLVNAAGLYTQYAYPLSMLAQGVLFLIVWLLAPETRPAGRLRPQQRPGAAPLRAVGRAGDPPGERLAQRRDRDRSRHGPERGWAGDHGPMPG